MGAGLAKVNSNTSGSGGGAGGGVGAGAGAGAGAGVGSSAQPATIKATSSVKTQTMPNNLPLFNSVLLLLLFCLADIKLISRLAASFPVPFYISAATSKASWVAAIRSRGLEQSPTT